MKIIAKIAILLLSILLISAAAATAYYFAVTANVRLQPEQFTAAENTAEIFDLHDQKITQVNFTQKHKSILIGDVPDHVKDAFISAEDKNFYTHRGLDYKRMARALFANLKAGAFKQGASTISQQLVKNTQLNSEKTLARKLKEIKLTRQLEKKYSKDQILEMYLNTIYFGHACYGIVDASNFYFAKDAQNLSLDEAAMLAAIIRSPNNYSPFVNPDACMRARNSVLARMFVLGKITEKEKSEAENTALPLPHEKSVSSDSYLDAVYEEFRNLPIYAPYQLRGTFRIYTYLDSDMQNYLCNLSTDADRSGKSLLVCDNRSGGINAFYSTEGILRRQPGSAIKPLAVYAPAIEENLISPATPVCDEAVDFNGYSPSNYRDQYKGWVSARDALAQSLNVPAVKILNELGLEKSTRYLQKLGLPVLDSDLNLSLALGGMTQGFTLNELVSAYTALANGGKFIPAAFIRKIEDPEGHVLYERSPSPVQVFSRDTAQLTNLLLRKAVTDGTAKKLNTLPFEICAKTGTCGTDAGNTDAWSVSYTTAHTVGVWMGNADNSLTDITGGGLPCHYAMLILKKMYGGTALPEPFDMSSAVLCRLDKLSYDRDHVLRLAADDQPQSTVLTDYFRASNLPNETSTVYTAPKANASIRVKNQNVIIELCHAEYYDFVIKRENNGKTVQIFDGKAGNEFTDKNLKSGQKYSYTVCPYYIKDDGTRVFGEEIRLPTVSIRQKPREIPDNWWEH